LRSARASTPAESDTPRCRSTAGLAGESAEALGLNRLVDHPGGKD